MNTLLAAVTIVTFGLCGPGNSTISEKLTIEKNTNISKEKTITYKKVPTKWVKITKKSN